MQQLAFFAHRWCVANDPIVLTFTVIGNLGIALAYYVISLHLWKLTRIRAIGAIGIGTNTFYLFAAFILACGTTHLMDIWVLWQPVYWRQVAVTLITAVISITAAIVFVPRTIHLISRGMAESQDRWQVHQAIESAQGTNLEKLRDILREEGLM